MTSCCEKRVNKEQKSNKSLRVHVEGNIGAGKSCLLDFLKKKSCIEVHPEPLEKWQNLDGKNIFDLYYSNPKKYGYTFETYVLLTLAQRNLETSDKAVQVYERSLQCAQYCFLNALEQTKAIDLPMKTILDEYCRFMNKYFNEEADLIIYVRTTPSNVIDRIKNRGRSEERGLSKNYLTLLHSLHEKWIATVPKGKVFVIDGNLKFEDLENEYMNCFHAIEQSLYNKELESMKEEFLSLSLTSEN